MVWVNKKASSQRRESFLVIVACVSITDTLMIYIPCEEEEDKEETGMLTDAAPSAFFAATSLPSRVYPSTLFDEASLGLDMIITPQTGE